MYKFQYKKYPDKIGYWFYRTGEIKYVDFDDSDIEALQEDMKDVYIKYIKRNMMLLLSILHVFFVITKMSVLIKLNIKMKEQQQKLK